MRGLLFLMKKLLCYIFSMFWQETTWNNLSSPHLSWRNFRTGWRTPQDVEEKNGVKFMLQPRHLMENVSAVTNSHHLAFESSLTEEVNSEICLGIWPPELQVVLAKTTKDSDTHQGFWYPNSPQRLRNNYHPPTKKMIMIHDPLMGTSPSIMWNP